MLHLVLLLTLVFCHMEIIGLSTWLSCAFHFYTPWL